MQNNRQYTYLAKILVRFGVYYTLLVLQSMFQFDEVVLGVAMLLGSVSLVICLIRDKILVTPLALGELLMFSFGLYELHLATDMSYMDPVTTAVVITSILGWDLVCIFNMKMIQLGQDGELSHWEKGNENLKWMIILSFLVSGGVIVLEWWVAGGIPILRSDMETFRFKVVFNSTLHVIAMCMKYIPFLVAVYCKFDVFYLLRRQKLIAFIFGASLLFLVATAFRGELMAGLCMMAFAYFLYSRPKLKYVLIIAVVFVVVMAIYPVLRGYFMYGNAYVRDQKSISTYPELWFLTPIYQTLSASFHFFNKDIAIFPNIEPFGMGQYTVWCNIPFVDGVETLAQTQNRVWNNNFFAELTATVFGSLYADFGYLGCIVGLLLIALLCNAAFSYFVKRRDMKSLALYLFIFYKGFQMIYDNTFDFVAVLYLLYLWLVFSFIVKEPLPKYQASAPLYSEKL